MNQAPTFQQFWDAYGLKRDRIAAERVWNRLTAKDKRKAIRAIDDYTADCARRGISRMYAQGYLSHRRFEDDFTVPDKEAPTTVAPINSAPRPNSSAPRPNSSAPRPNGALGSVGSGCAAAKMQEW